MDQTPLPNPLPTSWGEGIGKSHGGGIKMRPLILPAAAEGFDEADGGGVATAG